jgi:hypothetical protein
MTIRKERLTVTVDPELVEAGNRAVAEGRAGSLSGWVNDALADRAQRDRRLHALSEAVAAYERDFGVITGAEMAAQGRKDREQSVVARRAAPAPATKRRRPGVV